VNDGGINAVCRPDSRPALVQQPHSDSRKGRQIPSRHLAADDLYRQNEPLGLRGSGEMKTASTRETYHCTLLYDASILLATGLP